jgi:hypothetical protein
MEGQCLKARNSGRSETMPLFLGIARQHRSRGTEENLGPVGALGMAHCYFLGTNFAIWFISPHQWWYGAQRSDKVALGLENARLA